MTKNHATDMQAIVLCGSGHRLLPLVDEEKLPKCMLPVANRPMLYYPLTWLQQAGISDIIVVAHATGGQRIQNYLTRIFEGGKVDLVLLEDYGGTVDALLAIKPHIKGDFMVIGCDLLTDLSITQLLQRWRPKESTEPKHRLSDEGGIIVGLSKSNARTLTWMHKDDLEEGNMEIPMAILARYPQMRLCMGLADVHLYLFRRSIFDGSTNSSHGSEDSLFHDLFSVREDLVPRLVRRQLGSGDHYRCETVIVETGYCLRMNTLSALAEAGKQLVRMAAAQGTRLISQAAEIGNKAQIGNDSIIGDHSKIGDRSSVKRSVVGSHVQIGSNVKVSNSIILDHAVIEDSVKLEGCIVGLRVVVGERSYLKDCDVGSDHVVERETTCKGEVLGGNREIYLDDEN